MPLFAKLFAATSALALKMVLLLVHGYWAVRIAVITAMATAYIACIALFVTVISPLFSAFVSTQYGQVVGLAFPPMAGTVVAALVGLWACILAKNFTTRLLKAI